MFNWLHTNLPDPVLLSIGPVSVHWYGLLMVVGLGLGYMAARYWWERAGRGRKDFDDLFFHLALWGFVGARLYHVLNEVGFYFRNPGSIFAIWNGGLAIHGAILAGVLVLYVFYRKGRIGSPLLVADISVVGLVIGQAIGRWGNYFNQELFGSPSSAAWSIPIAFENRPPGYELAEFFHPTFLYESLGALVLFALLWMLHTRRVEKGMRVGVITSVYLLGYSILRIIMETFRIDDVPEVLGVRLPLLVSAVLVVISLYLLYYCFGRSSGSTPRDEGLESSGKV